MKKISLFFTFLFISAISNAQFTVEDYDGVPILDGDVRTFNSVDASVATLKFWIFNQNANDDILMKIKLESITNGDGTNYQFCFGDLCIFDVQEGTTYPVSGIPETIPVGGTNLPENKFQNENPGDGTNYPVDYVWRFFQVDQNGDETGDEITFTYRFDPTLNVNDFENNSNILIHNTIVSDLLIVESLDFMNFEIFNITGQLLKTGQMESGINNINTTGFNTGLNFIRFTDNNGNTSTMKFVVK
jgi:hypothetical protein